MVMVADARPLVYPGRDHTDTFGRPKAGWATRREAQHVRRVQRVLDQHVYRCSCGWYHLGHRRARP